MKNNIPWEIIIAKLNHSIMATDEAALSIWLQSDENLEIYKELCEVWRRVQSESTPIEPDVEFYWNRLQSRMHPENGTAKQRIRKSSRFIPLMRYAVVACIGALLAFAGLTMMSESKPSQYIYSNLNGKNNFFLPDGTEVWLHNNTRISYTDAFNINDRIIELEGEAFFKVAVNKNAPFIVKTEHLSVTAHGTEFNVSSFTNNKYVTVSLTEGAVSVQTIQNTSYLKPGDIALYNKEKSLIEVSRGDVWLNASWANTKKVFKEEDLEEICKYLSIWYNVDIHLDPELSKKYQYTFTLQDERLEDILRHLSLINPIQYKFINKSTVSITKSK